MGGVGSGGARPNTGPKRRSLNKAVLAGEVRKPAVATPPAAPTTAQTVTPPAWMDQESLAVWNELLPLATGVTAATASSFARHCRNIVIERNLASSVQTVAGPDHRGMLLRVEAGDIRFCLTHAGKPVAPAKPVDPFEEFDGLHAIQGGKSA